MVVNSQSVPLEERSITTSDSMDELKDLINILNSRGPVTLVAGESAYLNRTFIPIITLSFIKKHRRSKVIYFHCEGSTPRNLRFLKDFKNKVYLFRIGNLDEQYHIVNLLPMLLTAEYYRKYMILIVFDDFVSHYLVAPASMHKTAGGSLLAEQLAILRMLSHKVAGHMILTSYLLSDKRPLLWKIFSKYVDTLVTIRENDGLVEVNVLNEDLAIIESYNIELDELVEKLEFEDS